jgi:hypothetical protein
MSPQQARKMEIALYRQMSPERRYQIACERNELANEMTRIGIRFQNPGADEAQVERLLNERLILRCYMILESKGRLC